MRPENVGWRADQKREIGPKERCSKVYKNGGPVGRTMPNFTFANRYVKGGMVFLFGGRCGAAHQVGVEGCRAEGVLSTPDDKGEEGGGRPLVGGNGVKGRMDSGVYEVQ